MRRKSAQVLNIVMATISGIVEIYDSFEQPLMRLTSMVGNAVDATQRLGGALGRELDTSGVARAEKDFDSLNEKMMRVNSPVITAQADFSRVYENVPKFEESRASVEEITRQLSKMLKMQEAIQEVGKSMYILPDGVQKEIGFVNRELERMRDGLEFARENKLEMGADVFNAQITAISKAIDGLVDEQLKIDGLMGNIASKRIDLRLNADNSQAVQAIDEVKRAIDNWVSFEGLEIFTNTGVERFNQELANVNSLMEMLGNTQYKITQYANEAEFLSPQASYDIQNVENRLQSLLDMLRHVEETSLDIGSDKTNAQLEYTREKLYEMVGLQNSLNEAISNADISKINTAYLELVENIRNAEKYVRDNFSEIEIEVPPVQIPIRWQTGDLQVFTGTGIERFQQEIGDVEARLRRISEAQLNIAANSEQTSIFPAALTSDMQGMQTRITAIQRQMQLIQNQKINLGTADANNGLEQMRGNLSQIESAQLEVNAAMDAMDIERANRAYLRMNELVANTERFIRDNVVMQDKFTKSVQKSDGAVENLMSTIRRIVGAYASIQTVGRVIELSDTMTQTTARLDMIVGENGSVEALQNKIFASAQNSRGSYQATADAVAKLGLTAGDAFNGNDEIVAFLEQINKQFVLAGTSASEVDAVMLQLTQAMGSGVLRGDELNSIFEQAPTIIQSIAKYMDVPIGKIRDMASEGQISAEIVKNAMFYCADETNAKFESMPTTFDQVWTSFQNQALAAFQPVLDRLGEIANSDKFQRFADNAARALVKVADIAINIFDAVASVGNFISENWEYAKPVIWGVVGALAAAQIAQIQLNVAMQSCPLVWIIDLIIVVITLGYLLSQVIEDNIETIFGGIYVVGAFFKNIGFAIANFAIALYNSAVEVREWIDNLVYGAWNAEMAVFQNIGTFFDNIIKDIQIKFWEFVQGFMIGLGMITDKLNSLTSVFGLELDASGINQQIDNAAAKIAELENNKGQYLDVGEEFQKGWNTHEIDFGKAWNDGINHFNLFEEGWADNAFKEGERYGAITRNVIDGTKEQILSFLGLANNGELGAGAAEGLINGVQPDSSYDYTKMLANISSNTDSIADNGINISEEDLKYLRDSAEHDTINRFTTAEISIDMSGMQNMIKDDRDIDGVVEKFTDELIEAVNFSAEGVHV